MYFFENKLSVLYYFEIFPKNGKTVFFDCELIVHHIPEELHLMSFYAWGCLCLEVYFVKIICIISQR